MNYKDVEQKSDDANTSNDGDNSFRKDRITMEDVDFDTQLTEENSTIDSRYS